MRAHIVHAHPEPKSFTAAMRDVAAGELRAMGYGVTISDLYAMKFNPVLSRDDFTQLRRPEHLAYTAEQRNAWYKGHLAPDIKAEADLTLAADLLVLTFPVYWFGMPAIMKGWIDRIFLSGPFYTGAAQYGAAGMKGKRALVAASLGGREHMFGPRGLHGELATGMLRHLLWGSLGVVGYDVVEPYFAFHAPFVEPAERQAMLEKLRDHVRRVDSLPVLPMPDLTRFDDKFVPLP